MQIQKKLQVRSDIAIAGHGVLGKAVHAYFHNAPWFTEKEGKFAIAEKKTIIILCLPTPYHPKEGYDYRALFEVIDRFKTPKVFVLKSTVMPLMTDNLARLFPQHTFIFNPEFLRAKSSKKDFANPDRQIFGIPKYGTTRARKWAHQLRAIFPKAPFTKVMDASAAEMAKVAGNTYLAMRVVFANQLFDFCSEVKVDYDAVIRAMSADPRIGKSHWKIFTDGFRGFSGMCFPKDTAAFVWGSKSQLIKKVIALNNMYQKKR